MLWVEVVVEGTALGGWALPPIFPFPLEWRLDLGWGREGLGELRLPLPLGGGVLGEGSMFFFFLLPESVLKAGDVGPRLEEHTLVRGDDFSVCGGP